MNESLSFAHLKNIARTYAVPLSRKGKLLTRQQLLQTLELAGFLHDDATSPFNILFNDNVASNEFSELKSCNLNALNFIRGQSKCRGNGSDGTRHESLLCVR